MNIPVGSTEPLSLGAFLDTSGQPVSGQVPEVTLYLAGSAGYAPGGGATISATDAHGMATYTPDPSDFYADGELAIVGSVAGAMQWQRWHQVGTIDVDLGRRVLGGGGADFIDLAARSNVPTGQGADAVTLLAVLMGFPPSLMIAGQQYYLLHAEPNAYSSIGFSGVFQQEAGPEYVFFDDGTEQWYRGMDPTNHATAVEYKPNVDGSGGPDGQYYWVSNNAPAHLATAVPIPTDATEAIAPVLAAISTAPIVLRSIVGEGGLLEVDAGDDYLAGDNRAWLFGLPASCTIDFTGATPTLDITAVRRGNLPEPEPALTVAGTVVTGSFTIRGVSYTKALQFQPTGTQTAELTAWSPQAYVYRVRAVWSNKTVTLVRPTPCTALW